MSSPKQQPARGPGRPRAFDQDAALDRAMRVFWEKGYEGASLAALTEAMGISRPSLYAAFGDKEALCCKAIERYVSIHEARLQAAIGETTARGVIERVWLSGGAAALGSRDPRGCFLVQGALACGDENEPVRRALAEERRRSETVLRERFERAVEEGDLPTSIDPGALAGYVMAVNFGLAVHSAGGAERTRLKAIAEMAVRMLGLPG